MYLCVSSFLLVMFSLGVNEIKTPHTSKSHAEENKQTKTNGQDTAIDLQVATGPVPGTVEIGNRLGCQILVSIYRNTYIIIFSTFFTRISRIEEAKLKSVLGQQKG